MKDWTRTAPVELGWYWWKRRKNGSAQVVSLMDNDIVFKLYGMDGFCHVAKDMRGWWWPLRIEEPKS